MIPRALYDVLNVDTAKLVQLRHQFNVFRRLINQLVMASVVQGHPSQHLFISISGCDEVSVWYRVVSQLRLYQVVGLVI